MSELVWQLRKGPEGAPYAFAAFNKTEKRTNFFDKAEDLRGFLMKRGSLRRGCSGARRARRGGRDGRGHPAEVGESPAQGTIGSWPLSGRSPASSSRISSWRPVSPGPGRRRSSRTRWPPRAISPSKPRAGPFAT